MAITGLNINLPASSTVSPIVSNAAPSATDKAKSIVDTPPSTIVTLSAQALKLSQTSSPAQTSSTQPASQLDAVAGKNLEAVPKEANEATGIQFLAGATRSGRISTYA